VVWVLLCEQPCPAGSGQGKWCPVFSKLSRSFRAFDTFWLAVPALLAFFTLKGKHATPRFSLELTFLFLSPLAL